MNRRTLAAIGVAIAAALVVVLWTLSQRSSVVPERPAAEAAPGASQSPTSPDIRGTVSPPASQPRTSSAKLIEHGIALEEAGRRDEAVEAFWQAIEIDSDRAAEGLGALVAADTRERIHGAIAQFHEALTVDRRTALDHHKMADALAHVRLDRAGGMYWDAYKTNLAYARSLFVLWQGLTYEGVFEEVASSLNAQLSRGVGSPDVHCALAVVHWTKGDYTQAWRQVHLTQSQGGEIDPAFMRAMHAKMPEPDE